MGPVAEEVRAFCSCKWSFWPEQRPSWTTRKAPRCCQNSACKIEPSPVNGQGNKAGPPGYRMETKHFRQLGPVCWKWLMSWAGPAQISTELSIWGSSYDIMHCLMLSHQLCQGIWQERITLLNRQITCEMHCQRMWWWQFLQFPFAAPAAALECSLTFSCFSDSLGSGCLLQEEKSAVGVSPNSFGLQYCWMSRLTMESLHISYWKLLLI